MNFKFWDKIIKRMFVPTAINLHGHVLHTHEHGETWLTPEFFDILLSTGEKTKDGEELYQGDIVKLYHKGDWVICHIVFHKAAFRLQWPDGYINGMPINSNKYIKLGNIYEHPHLIQQ